jgi:peptidoglycan DL-endopeptidase CwlO
VKRNTGVALAVTIWCLFAVSGAVARSLPYLSWFPKGQCTRWAYVKRPDIVNRGVSQYGFSNWNAYLWAANARREGYSVNRHPRAGDIAVWPRNVDGAGSIGHVAYVVSVSSDMTIRITEVDWNGSRTATPRTLTRAQLHGLQFIHHLG